MSINADISEGGAAAGVFAMHSPLCPCAGCGGMRSMLATTAANSMQTWTAVYSGQPVMAGCAEGYRAGLSSAAQSGLARDCIMRYGMTLGRLIDEALLQKLAHGPADVCRPVTSELNMLYARGHAADREV